MQDISKPLSEALAETRSWLFYNPGHPDPDDLHPAHPSILGILIDHLYVVQVVPSNFETPPLVPNHLLPCLY
jgi:hypothetical protein